MKNCFLQSNEKVYFCKKIEIYKMNNTILEDQRRLTTSGVRDVFVPSKPVDQHFFCGRVEEVEKLINNFGTPGMHILLYGDRGVGKTSLANYASQLAVGNQIKERQIVIRCTTSDTFETISQQILQKLDLKIKTSSVTSKNFQGSSKFVSGGKNVTEESLVYYDLKAPTWLAEQIKDMDCIIMVDEFDVIRKSEDKQKLSQLLKSLSDTGSKVSFLVVGIAMSAVELLEGHPSVTRCITEIKLDRMTDDEIEDIINKGEERIHISFDKQVKKMIVKASSGFPYFAHLLALKAAEIAIIEEHDVITKKIYEKGVSKAIDSIEVTLHEQYVNVVGENEKKKNLMYCAALLGDGEFTSRQLRDKYKEITGDSIEQLEINNSISKAMSDNTSTILRKKRKGVYFFNDPRMPVYIKLLER